MANKGLYIVLEGISGCGKSTQMEILKKYLPEKYPDKEFVFGREPGGTPRAEEIRTELKNNANLCPLVEARLFAEARKSTLDEVVRPALRRGAVVVFDRSIFSNDAYQGRGRELGDDWIWHMNEEVVGDTLPDLAIIFDINLAACLERSGRENPDKFDREGKAFWGRVMNGYEQMPKIASRFGFPTRFVFIRDKEGRRNILDINWELTRILDWEIREWAGMHPEGQCPLGLERRR